MNNRFCMGGGNAYRALPSPACRIDCPRAVGFLGTCRTSHWGQSFELQEVQNRSQQGPKWRQMGLEKNNEITSGRLVLPPVSQNPPLQNRRCRDVHFHSLGALKMDGGRNVGKVQKTV